jgi:hypothetical protein
MDDKQQIDLDAMRERDAAADGAGNLTEALLDRRALLNYVDELLTEIYGQVCRECDGEWQDDGKDCPVCGKLRRLASSACRHGSTTKVKERPTYSDWLCLKCGLRIREFNQTILPPPGSR